MPAVAARRLLLAFGVAAGITAACARGPAASPGAARRPDVALRVENRGTRPLTILYSRAGQLIRLGDVGSASTATFRLGDRQLAEAGAEQFLVARSGPTGRGLYKRSERLIVQPGQQITWVLQEQLEQSTLTVQ